jgi:hypothetical protein
MTGSDLPDGMCEKTLQISNADGEIDAIILEPWVDQIALKVGDIVEIRGVGPADGAAIAVDEIGRGRVVWGWPGALLHVSVNGALLDTYSARTVPPGLPPGMTFKDFLTLTGAIGAPDTRRS